MIHVMQLIGSTGLYGAERWILALVKALDSIYIKTTIVNLVDREGEKSDIVKAAIERGMDAVNFYTGGKFNPIVAIRLAKWMKQHDIHIIHTHGFKSDMVGLLTARLDGCKVVTTPHGWSLEKDKKLMLYEKIDRFIFNLMDMVCPLSIELSDSIKKLGMGNRKIRLILNGVDLDEIDSVKEKNRLYHDSFLVGYIGQLIDRKDLFTLLKAMKIVTDNQRDIKLLIIGDGYRRDNLQKEVIKLALQKKIDFMGFRQDAITILKTFDAFVLPSLEEGIPRCLMEAMACEVPVIVSDIPGNRNLVINGETGLLFKLGDARELSETILYLMNNKEKARYMVIKAREKIEKEFSNKRMAEEYTQLYNELVGQIK
jgi:glycosyltransferase involved in cell wall biosynthesis